MAYHHTPIIKPRRKIPISRSRCSYFNPSWEVGTWNDFGFRDGEVWRTVPVEFRTRHLQPRLTSSLALQEHSGNSLMSSTMSQMEREMKSDMDRQMRSMEERMNSSWKDMFRGMTTLMPLEGRRPASLLSRDDWIRGDWSLDLPDPKIRTDLALMDRGALAISHENPVITKPDGSREFKLDFDVRQFNPEEIVVRTEDKVLSVHARHEEKRDGGTELREYARQFTLPAGLEPESLNSQLSPDGVLSISAPLPDPTPAIEAPKDKTIPIAIQHSK